MQEDFRLFAVQAMRESLALPVSERWLPAIAESFSFRSKSPPLLGGVCKEPLFLAVVGQQLLDQGRDRLIIRSPSAKEQLTTINGRCVLCWRQPHGQAPVICPSPLPPRVSPLARQGS